MRSRSIWVAHRRVVDPAEFRVVSTFFEVDQPFCDTTRQQAPAGSSGQPVPAASTADASSWRRPVPRPGSRHPAPRRRASTSASSSSQPATHLLALRLDLFALAAGLARLSPRPASTRSCAARRAASASRRLLSAFATRRCRAGSGRRRPRSRSPTLGCRAAGVRGGRGQRHDPGQVDGLEAGRAERVGQQAGRQRGPGRGIDHRRAQRLLDVSGGRVRDPPPGGAAQVTRLLGHGPGQLPPLPVERAQLVGAQRALAALSSSATGRAPAALSYTVQITSWLSSRQHAVRLGTTSPTCTRRGSAGALAYVACQKAGSLVGATRVWNQLVDGRWVTDHYDVQPVRHHLQRTGAAVPVTG